jgi:hypothetical protein
MPQEMWYFPSSFSLRQTQYQLIPITPQWHLVITSTHQEHTLPVQRKEFLWRATCLTGQRLPLALPAGSISPPGMSIVVCDAALFAQTAPNWPPIGFHSFLIFLHATFSCPTPHTSSSPSRSTSASLTQALLLFISSQAILHKRLQLGFHAARQPERVLPARPYRLLPSPRQEPVARRRHLESRQRGLACQA